MKVAAFKRIFPFLSSDKKLLNQQYSLRLLKCGKNKDMKYIKTRSKKKKSLPHISRNVTGIRFVLSYTGTVANCKGCAIYYCCNRTKVTC